MQNIAAFQKRAATAAVVIMVVFAVSVHTSGRPLRSRLPSPPALTLVLAPYGSACAPPPATPAFAPPATLALALARDSGALPSGHGSARHASGGLLRSRLLRSRLLSPLP